MTDRYAVFGNPVMHSKSPMIHGAFAKSTGQDLAYEAIEAPVDGFAAAVTEFRANEGRGSNVTTPFKLEAFALATDRSERARLAGAVNALKFDGDRVLAENFDGVGLVNDIQRNLGFPFAGKRILLLGAGGAARGAVLPFLEERPQTLFVANRSVTKADVLAEEFSPFGELATGGYEDLGGQRFDIVVNATSASLRGELPPVPVSAFAEGCLAYDLVYGRGLTPFLRRARDAGSRRIADGIGMLVEQAAEAFLWWRGVRPETTPLINGLSVSLA